MKLIISCVLVMLLASNIEMAKKRRKKLIVANEFNDANITTDLGIKAPQCLLTASYDNAQINLGNYIFPGFTTDPPLIDYPVEPGCRYTLMILDLDFPSPDNPYLRSILLALYVNIVDLDLETACEVAEYIPVNPPPGSPPHRIVLLLFKQTEKIDCKCEELIYLAQHRSRFSVADFLSKYRLNCDPVAGNYFTTAFPEDLDDFCNSF